MRLGWDNVSVEELRKGFKGKKLEELAREIARLEIRSRDLSVQSIEGPAEGKDGGRDVEVCVERNAHSANDAAYRSRSGLTWSLLGDARQVAVSCKTNRDLAALKKDALKDAGGTEGGARVVEVLKGGGRLVILTTLPFTASNASAKRTPLAGKVDLVDRLASAYAKMIKVEADALKAQIAIVDGNDLVEYFNVLKPHEMSSQLLERVGVTDWPDVLGYDAALESLARDRPAPRYLEDQQRTRLSAAIRAFVESDHEDDGFYVVGAPGVGKSRALLESLVTFRDRVLVVFGADRAQELILRRYLLTNAPRCLLVVDDASVESLATLHNVFRHARPQRHEHERGARIIAVVPAGEEAIERGSLPRARVFKLGPLERNHARALVAEALGGSEEAQVETIAQLTGGYPWFGLLVAQEVSGGARIPTTTHDAARLAIAPETLPARERVMRARAMLAAMIARPMRWSDQNDDERDAIARAVDLRDRQELGALIDACSMRGILRRDAYLYVTPSVLEGEVWRIVCHDEDPDPERGPRRTVDRMRRNVPDLVSQFIDRLRQNKLSDADRLALARVLFRVLDDEVHDLDALVVRKHAAYLRFCAEPCALSLSTWMVALVERSSIDELRRRVDAHPSMVAALARAARSGAPFELIERGLFALAAAEVAQEPDSASMRWAMLFHPTLPLGHAGVTLRIDTLRRRCLDEDVALRRCAVVAMRNMLVPRASMTLDGDEDPPSPLHDEDALQLTRATWTLLFQCVRDANTMVAEAACEVLVAALVVDNHRLAAIDETELARALRQVPESTRAALRRTLKIEQHLSEYSGVASLSVFGVLEVATRPQNFIQRLRDQLHVPLSTSLMEPERSAAIDEELAHEGLRPPEFLLVHHLDVLDEPEAERSAAFAIVLGRTDHEAILLDPLLRRVHENHNVNVLSAYCAGHARGGRSTTVHTWLRAWSAHPALTDLVVVAAARCGGEEPLRIVHDLIKARMPSTSALRFFASAPWNDTPDNLIIEVLSTLLSREGRDVASIALRMTERHLKHRSPLVLLPIVRQAVSRAALGLEPLEESRFERHLRWMIDHGEVVLAVIAVLDALQAPRASGRVLLPLAREIARDKPSSFWEALRTRLEHSNEDAAALAARLEYARIAPFLPVEVVRSWVGRDPRRAVLIASLVSFDDHVLSPLVVALLQDFDREAPSTCMLAAKLHTSTGGAPDLAAFYEARAACVREWTSHPIARIAAWATRELPELEQRSSWYARTEHTRLQRVGS